MTEQPNTAKIRAIINRGDWWRKEDGDIDEVILGLCDALDEARDTADIEMERAIAQASRAKAAEAHIAACGCNTAEGWSAHDQIRALEAKVERCREFITRLGWDATELIEGAGQ